MHSGGDMFAPGHTSTVLRSTLLRSTVLMSTVLTSTVLMSTVHCPARHQLCSHPSYLIGLKLSQRRRGAWNCAIGSIRSMRAGSIHMNSLIRKKEDA